MIWASRQYVRLIGLVVCLVAEGSVMGGEKFVIESDVIATNDKEVRERIDEIVFVRGVVEYESGFKNPISTITTSYGVTYDCMGMQKYVGKEVIMAVIPKLQTLGTGPQLTGRVPANSSNQAKSVYFVHCRVVTVMSKKS
jgi:hypothetical protein